MLFRSMRASWCCFFSMRSAHRQSDQRGCECLGWCIRALSRSCLAACVGCLVLSHDNSTLRLRVCGLARWVALVWLKRMVTLWASTSPCELEACGACSCRGHPSVESVGRGRGAYAAAPSVCGGASIRWRAHWYSLPRRKAVRGVRWSIRRSVPMRLRDRAG